MLQFMEGLPAGIIGIRATGTITKEDYTKVLAPKLDELSKKGEKPNYLTIFQTDLTALTAAAWWEDLKTGIKHFNEWHKIAVLTDRKGIEWFSNTFSFMFGGRIHAFPLEEKDKAIAWLLETDDEDEHHPGTKPADTFTDNDSEAVYTSKSSNKGQGPAGENL
jgi:hypothetical protein